MAARGLLSSSQTINFQPSHCTFDLRMLVLCCAPCKTSPPAVSKSIWGGRGQPVCKLLLFPNQAPQRWREISSHPELLSFMVSSIYRSLQIPKSVFRQACPQCGSPGLVIFMEQRECQHSWRSMILAYEIRGAQHAEGHIHRDRNMLWIQGFGAEGSCAVNPVHWICFFRLIHP